MRVRFAPGARVPNYALWPPNLDDRTAVRPNATTVAKETTLRELLKPNMGLVHWASCVGVQNCRGIDPEFIRMTEAGDVPAVNTRVAQVNDLAVVRRALTDLRRGVPPATVAARRGIPGDPSDDWAYLKEELVLRKAVLAREAPPPAKRLRLGATRSESLQRLEHARTMVAEARALFATGRAQVAALDLQLEQQKTSQAKVTDPAVREASARHLADLENLIGGMKTQQANLSEMIAKGEADILRQEDAHATLSQSLASSCD